MRYHTLGKGDIRISVHNSLHHGIVVAHVFLLIGLRYFFGIARRWLTGFVFIQPVLHHADFTLLGIDDFLRKRFHLGIFAILQFHFCHRNCAFMMRYHAFGKTHIGILSLHPCWHGLVHFIHDIHISHDMRRLGLWLRIYCRSHMMHWLRLGHACMGTCSIGTYRIGTCSMGTWCRRCILGSVIFCARRYT